MKEKHILKLYQKEILEQLKKAGPKGLTKHQLGVKRPKSVKGLALEALEKESKIGNLGTHRKNRYVLVQHYKPFEIACELVDHNAKAAGIIKSGALFLLIRKDLAKGCEGEVRKKVDEAINRLVMDQKLVKLRRGRSRYFLHSDILREVLAEQAEIPAFETADPEPPSIKRGDAFTAYLRVRNYLGHSKVEIFELQQEMDVPMDQLANFLLEENSKGKVVLSRGNWSRASEAIRSGAIEINGQPHLLVEFKE